MDTPEIGALSIFSSVHGVHGTWVASVTKIWGPTGRGNRAGQPQEETVAMNSKLVLDSLTFLKKGMIE